MSGTRSAVVVLAAGAATGALIVVALLLAVTWSGCASGAVRNFPTPPAAIPTGPEPSRTAPVRAPRVREAESARARAPRRAADDQAAEADPLPSVEVEVRYADGAFVPGADVYALIEGTAGPVSGVDDWDVPSAPTDAAGRCRLTVPLAARYDVGAVKDTVHGLAESVAIPSDGVVTVTLRRAAEVRVTFPDGLDEFPVRTRLHTDSHASCSSRPGRGQVPDVSREVVGKADEALLWSVEAGLPLEFSTPLDRLDDRVVFEPQRFTAPGSATVGLPTYHAQVHVVLSPAGRQFAAPVAVDVRFAWDPSYGEEVVRTIEVGEHRALGDASFEFGAAAPKQWMTLRWSGDGVVPGQQLMELVAGEEADHSIVVEIGDLPPSCYVRCGYTVRLEEGLRPPGDLSGWEGDETGSTLSVGLGDLTSPYRVTAGRRSKWAIVYDWDAGVIGGPVALHPGGVPAELVVRKGGKVVVVPERDLPEGCRPTIRRADRQPFVADHTAVLSVAAGPGLILGPFEPGEVVLELSVPGARPMTATLTIRALGYATLAVPARIDR